jgi:hypothetical protein
VKACLHEQRVVQYRVLKVRTHHGCFSKVSADETGALGRTPVESRSCEVDSIEYGAVKVCAGQV